MAQTQPNREISRKRFLQNTTKAIIAFITTAIGIPVLGYVAAPGLKKKTPRTVSAGRPEDFPIGEARAAEFTFVRRDGWVDQSVKELVWVIRKGEQDFTVYNPHCTHLGCIVNWNPQQQKFFSPCHGGIFLKTGEVVGGPPPRPLDTLEYRIEDGKLMVLYQDFILGIPGKTAA